MSWPPRMDDTRAPIFGRKAQRLVRLRGEDVTKHLAPIDISPEEIEQRFRAALWHIRERSRKRRLECEPIRLGRAV